MALDKNERWDRFFLGVADHYATLSKDPSTKVGAVIINDRRHILGAGFNGFPRGVKDHAHRYGHREVKYSLIAHAERNALDNAECSVQDCTLYVQLFPCSECTKSIIQRGIKRIVYWKTEVDPKYNATWSVASGQLIKIS